MGFKNLEFNFLDKNVKISEMVRKSWLCILTQKKLIIKLICDKIRNFTNFR